MSQSVQLSPVEADELDVEVAHRGFPRGCPVERDPGPVGRKARPLRVLPLVEDAITVRAVRMDRPDGRPRLAAPVDDHAREGCVLRAGSRRREPKSDGAERELLYDHAPCYSASCGDVPLLGQGT